jgi:TetR/AcrR family transcriptional regulator, lmrAB and yxaGH operons repressor
MALQKVTDDVVVEQLLAVFRAVGYDGATMSDLAQATGLQKASLYHRFPDGKQAMAQAVLDYIETASQTDIVAVLQHSALSPAGRLKTALTAIDALYSGGQLSCVLRALSLGSAAGQFRPQIARIFGGWIEGFAQTARALGHSDQKATRLATSIVVRVQGALILADTVQQPALFGQTLTEIETDFLA